MRKPSEISRMMEAAAAASRSQAWAVTVIEDTVAETLAWVLGKRGATLPRKVEAAAKKSTGRNVKGTRQVLKQA